MNPQSAGHRHFGGLASAPHRQAYFAIPEGCAASLVPLAAGCGTQRFMLSGEHISTKNRAIAER
jgi:hypothetical protein